MPKPRIVYDRRYNLGFPGAQRLHPFDLRKYARAWRLLREELGSRLQELYAEVSTPIEDEALLCVHAPEYLAALKQSAVVAQAIEVPALRRAPWWLLNRCVLQPMRWATAGSVVAARAALECGLAFNLGGGFHHAKPQGGEGFSIYNDIAVAIAALRTESCLSSESRIAYIDLDAHLGNGVAWCVRHDPTVFLFDMHNDSIYPRGDAIAHERVDCPVPVPSGCSGSEYLRLLQERLPAFLDSISRTVPIALAVYNAGTDVLTGDLLGGMELSLDDVLARDRFVLAELRERRAPAVILTSGGYSELSHRAIVNLIAAEAQR